MILITGPYSSPDAEVKAARVKTIATACAALIIQTNQVAMSPLLSGLAIIEKSGKKLPDNTEFWKEFCRVFVRAAEEVYVLDMDGWDKSGGVADEINEAKERNIPVYLVHRHTLNFIKVL